MRRNSTTLNGGIFLILFLMTLTLYDFAGIPVDKSILPVTTLLNGNLAHAFQIPATALPAVWTGSGVVTISGDTLYYGGGCNCATGVATKFFLVNSNANITIHYTISSIGVGGTINVKLDIYNVNTNILALTTTKGAGSYNVAVTAPTDGLLKLVFSDASTGNLASRDVQVSGFSITDPSTATPTFTATPIPSDTPTPTDTETLTTTPTETPTFTETSTSVPTASDTSTPIETFTPTASDTPTEIATATPIPTDTPSPTFTATDTPTLLATFTNTPIQTLTSTIIPNTSTPIPTNTPFVPSTPIVTSIATNTETPLPTFTLIPTSTPTLTFDQLVQNAVQATLTALGCPIP